MNDTEINIKNELTRIVAGSFYDHQEIRIQENNRVRDIIRRLIEEIPTEKPEDKIEKKDYTKKYTDKQLIKLYEKLSKEGKIPEEKLKYINKILEVQKKAEKYEQEYKKLMDELIKEEPIYKEFLQNIKGISTILSANLIKEIGYCERATHISSLWKYMGMHVIEGKAPKREKGKKLDFNLKLRTLCYKISDSFIKQRTPFYRDIYDKEKQRQLNLMESQNKVETHRKEASHTSQETHTLEAPKSLLHADLRARRKCIKIFLAHYFMCAKELKPRPIRNPYEKSEPEESRNPNRLSEKPYVEEKLNHKHISNWKDAVLANISNKEKVAMNA